MKTVRLLAWSDFALAGTGFATVSKHVLNTLYSTNNFDIHHLAINYTGDFFDKSQVPYMVTAAKILDPRDPHGLKMFKRCLQKHEYDVVWIMNDLYVTHEIAGLVTECKNKYESLGKTPPIFIYYYPVDCQVSSWSSGMLEAVDIPVTYTDHGKEETLKTLPKLASKLRQIGHGVDTKIFKPAPKILRDEWRKQYLGISPDTTVVINVNRNSTRKQIPYSILAFKEFKKRIPNSILYLHMMEKDQGGDLERIIADAGLEIKTDVIYPKGFTLADPFSVEMVNKIYNIGDIFLSTHLGEGWGLSIVEAMACGVPVVIPDNTCMQQHLGTNSERGYLYPCDDLILIDHSGYRKKGLIPDIVGKMIEAYKDGPKEKNKKIAAALKYAQSIDWSIIGKQWLQLFQEALEQKPIISNNSIKSESV